MAGRNLYKQGATSRGFTLREINEATWKKAEDALGSAINEQWRGRIADSISCAIDASEYKRPSSQDIKRTLAAMSKLSPEAAAEAFEDCDLYIKILIRNDLFYIDTGGNTIIRADCVAAAIALSAFEPKEGRPSLEYRNILANEIVKWWRGLGGTWPCKAWVNNAAENGANPIVKFAVVFFSAVEGGKFDQKEAADYIRPAIASQGDGEDPYAQQNC